MLQHTKRHVRYYKSQLYNVFVISDVCICSLCVIPFKMILKIITTIIIDKKYGYLVNVSKSWQIVKSGVLSGADIKKSRSSGIVMLAGKYGILDKIWLGIS